MEALLPALALLACPIGMGLMMFFMAKGSRSGKADSAPTAHRASAPAGHPVSLEVLREEHRRLGEEIERFETRSANQDESVEQR
jgi:hypothetical protein